MSTGGLGAPRAVPEKHFTEWLLKYFRYHINDRYPRYEEVMRLAERQRQPKDSIFFFTPNHKDIFYEMQFSFFETTQCTEYGVIRDAFQEFFYIKAIKQAKSGMSHLELARGSLIDSDDINIMLMDLFSGQTEEDNLYNVAVLLDLEFTGRFLRYGARFEISSRQIHLGIYRMLKCFYVELWEKTFEIEVDDELHRYVNETIYRAYPTLERKRRLLFILLMLYATLMKQKTETIRDFRDSARSLQLVFQTIEEPFVTVSEISRFLNLYGVCNIKEIIIEETCERFVEEFPNAEGCMAPRSLKHLTRCQVRRCLGKSRNLPNGVWGLEIPRELENYILLQKTKEEFYPKYVAALASSKCSVSDELSTKKLETA